MAKSAESFMSQEFIAMAHRGGSLLTDNLGIENTVRAFDNAVKLGFRYIETDVQVTSDGVLVIFHDDSVTRLTDEDGKISDLPYTRLKQLRVGGREPIPTLDEVLERFPHVRFNIDMKVERTTALLADTLRKHNAEHRVCVGAFSQKRLRRFRRLCSGVTTSFGPLSVAALRLGFRPTGGDVFQIPISHRVLGLDVRLVTPQRVAAIHDYGRKVHVWTIDDPVVMHQLIDWGVDGIITDRPDSLKGVLRNRGMWSAQ
ncbi:glycerophosphodiester phosphodiesterase [Tessaracoccus caeni]|uniref:glycerophosphodiester phosphodiesterase n=1 Tax=Tessaracoccus caeni TaxID=3031239 RepID=UPI0023DC7BD5|nr:glycerophosphodiester phosphodiesterase [Tessaracoccus caeni]MDF1488543.1 glycerophosphodiester phosphodiesterase [Tessaracoccus caeni]